MRALVRRVFPLTRRKRFVYHGHVWVRPDGNVILRGTTLGEILKATFGYRPQDNGWQPPRYSVDLIITADLSTEEVSNER